MDVKKVIEYFDALAPTWDAELVPKDAVIGTILDKAGICAGQEVLDVACGTGVLFPHYLRRDVASVTGVDISPEMVDIATEKFFAEPRIRVICDDVVSAELDRFFDSVMVYNAFPHFLDPRQLIRSLADLTKTGGRLTVAHSMSRQQVNDHHKGSANEVSNGLMPVEELSELFAPYFHVDVLISDDEMYQVSGTKR